MAIIIFILFTIIVIFTAYKIERIWHAPCKYCRSIISKKAVICPHCQKEYPIKRD